MYHKTLKAPPSVSLDKVKVQNRLFDFKQSFYQLEFDRPPKLDLLLQIFQSLLRIGPPDATKFLANHEASVASQVKKLTNTKARHITRPLKFVRKFKSPWITAQQGLSVNPQFFYQSLRMNAIVRKMKSIGFDSFTLADLIYPDQNKTLTYLTMLIHLHDDVVPRLSKIFNSKLERSDFQNQRNHPESKWGQINTSIAEAKILREKLLSNLNQYRQKEIAQLKEIEELEDLYDNSAQKLHALEKDIKVISEETEAIKKEIRDLQDKMADTNEQCEKINEGLKDLLTKQELDDMEEILTKVEKELKQELAYLQQAIITARTTLDSLSEEDNWVHEMHSLAATLVKLRHKINQLTNDLKLGKQCQEEIDKLREDVKEMMERETQLRKEIDEIRRARDHQREGGSIRARMFQLKRELVQKQQKLEEMDHIIDQKKKGHSNIMTAMKDMERILRELEHGKSEMTKEFDAKMLTLKGHIDALMALSCSTAKHHQNN